MSSRKTLPLGIDVGTARTRVALCERSAPGDVRLIAVASRPTLGDPAGAIADACAELGTRERRCVLALPTGASRLSMVRFPMMHRRERERAARFEAARFIRYPLDEAAVRVTPLHDGNCVLGVARQRALDACVDAAKRARLRPIAVDDSAFALQRALPDADAIVDVGELHSVLLVSDEPIPVVATFETAGRAFTAAVIASLGIDEASAEQRKRTIGLAGAGEYARDNLVEQLAAAFIETRATARVELCSIALVGNGTRLPGFAEALERAVAVPVRMATLPTHSGQALPPDVVRAASPDWALAYGLALWECAA